MKDTTTMSVEELKAFAYDIIMQNAINQQNLEVIQKELQKRGSEMTEIPKSDKISEEDIDKK